MRTVGVRAVVREGVGPAPALVLFGVPRLVRPLTASSPMPKRRAASGMGTVTCPGGVLCRRPVARPKRHDGLLPDARGWLLRAFVEVVSRHYYAFRARDLALWAGPQGGRFAPILDRRYFRRYGHRFGPQGYRRSFLCARPRRWRPVRSLTREWLVLGSSWRGTKGPGLSPLRPGFSPLRPALPKLTTVASFRHGCFRDGFWNSLGRAFGV